MTVLSHSWTDLNWAVEESTLIIFDCLRSSDPPISLRPASFSLLFLHCRGKTKCYQWVPKAFNLPPQPTLYNQDHFQGLQEWEKEDGGERKGCYFEASSHHLYQCCGQDNAQASGKVALYLKLDPSCPSPQTNKNTNDSNHLECAYYNLPIMDWFPTSISDHGRTQHWTNLRRDGSSWQRTSASFDFLSRCFSALF